MTKKRLLTGTLVTLLMTACANQPPAGDPGVARNVILFIGDGIGFTTVTAAIIFDGHSLGLNAQ